MATVPANNFRMLLALGTPNFASDTFKLALMGSGFVFDEDSDDLYADISGDELSTAYGYTVGGVTLAGFSITQDDINDRAVVTWNNATWTASGGDIGPFVGGILYDDTVTDDPIVGYIDLGGEFTENNGGTLTITGVKVQI